MSADKFSGRLYEHLAPLETFSPEAFQPDADVPQELCNLMLTLALIFNDLSDLLLAGDLLRQTLPDLPMRKNRRWGTWLAMDSHAFRLIAGVLHELLSVIAANRPQLEHPLFVSVVKRLHRVEREAWASIIAAADGASNDLLGKSLVFIRNKAASHYDLRVIAAGYRHHFFESGRQNERAYVSRGDVPWSGRFYFADAAVAGLREKNIPRALSDADLMNTVSELLARVNFTLMDTVSAFIQMRGYAFRLEPEE